ncbi:MAG: hypothetical protein H7A46_06390 [Verrucomicrobiales bacterium]|nr:hypothetical protein [Verrucomicrobiales bacterium]
MQTYKKAFLLGSVAFLAIGRVSECRAGEAARLSDVPVARPSITRDQAEILRKRRNQDSPLQQGASPNRPSLTPLTAPPPGETRILTPREIQLLDQNKNWIFQDPSKTGLTEENLQRALGVRSKTAETEAGESGEEPKTAIERYLAEEQTRQETPDTEENPDATATRAPWLRNTPGTASGYEPYPTAQALRDDPLYLELTGLGDRMDPALEDSVRAARESARELRETMEQVSRGQVFGRMDARSLRQSLRPGGASNLRESGLDGLFGTSVGVESPVGPRVGTMLDPVNAYPDLTRQELDPVVARPSGTFDSMAPKPLFSDPQNGRSSMVRAPGSGLPDLLRASPVSGGLMPGLNNPVDSLQPAYSPTKGMRLQLQLPGRTF